MHSSAATLARTHAEAAAPAANASVLTTTSGSCHRTHLGAAEVGGTETLGHSRLGPFRFRKDSHGRGNRRPLYKHLQTQTDRRSEGSSTTRASCPTNRTDGAEMELQQLPNSCSCCSQLSVCESTKPPQMHQFHCKKKGFIF